MIYLNGLGTALVTPFTSEGEVDYENYRSLVLRQAEAGVDFLVPLGSTAETPCLDDGEKVELLRQTRELTDLPLVVGAGTNSLSATLRNIRLLDSCGPDCYLVVVPYYNKPTQEGIYQYFRAVADSTDRPIVLYNVPGRTGVNMTAETTLRLSRTENIVAVKEASGDISQILEIRRRAPEEFSVLSGNDDQTLELMEGGCQGVISVVSNIAPKQMKELTDAALRGDFETAARADLHLASLYRACFVESNPIPVKAALNLMGLCESEMRLPLTTAVPSTFSLMEQVLENL